MWQEETLRDRGKMLWRKGRPEEWEGMRRHRRRRASTDWELRENVAAKIETNWYKWPRQEGHRGAHGDHFVPGPSLSPPTAWFNGGSSGAAQPRYTKKKKKLNASDPEIQSMKALSKLTEQRNDSPTQAILSCGSSAGRQHREVVFLRENFAPATDREAPLNKGGLREAGVD